MSVSKSYAKAHSSGTCLVSAGSRRHALPAGLLLLRVENAYPHRQQPFLSQHPPFFFLPLGSLTVVQGGQKGEERKT